MTTISATDAAFEGFRLARERPMIIVYWTALWLLASLLIEFAAVKLGGPALAEFAGLSQAPLADRDPAILGRLYAELLPMLAVLVPINLVFYAVTSTAAYRLVLFRKDRPPALHLGVDEVRQLGVMVVIGAIMLGVEVLGLMAAFLVAALGMLVAPGLGAVAVGLGLAAVTGLMIYVGVRLSLAGPITLDRRRISPLGSWALTRGHFWPLFLAYFLTFALALIVVLLGAFIVGGLAAALGGGQTAASALVIPESASIADIFTPVRIVFLFGNAAFSALTFAIISAAPAVIYLELTSTEAARPRPYAEDSK